MVIRIHNIERWTQYQPGDPIVILGEGLAQRRIDFNVEAPTSVSLAMADRSVFLGAFQGMETIEFTCEAGCIIECTSEGEVWYYKNEGATAVVSELDDESYTDVMPDRTEIPPDLQRVMDLAMLNVHRRMDYMQRENEALRERVANRTQVDEETGEVTHDSAGGNEGTTPTAAGGTPDTVPEPSESGDDGTKSGK